MARVVSRSRLSRARLDQSPVLAISGQVPSKVLGRGAFQDLDLTGASLYLAVIAVIGLSLGALLRRTAAGLSVFAAVFFVVPIVTAYLPHSIQGFAPYLPSNAGGAVWGAGKLFGGQQLGPWTGFAVLCGYAVMLTGLAAWRLRRRDA
jgi:ABC-2 type transport system permease protein